MSLIFQEERSLKQVKHDQTGRLGDVEQGCTSRCPKKGRPRDTL
jgi:hypothetical protein